MIESKYSHAIKVLTEKYQAEIIEEDIFNNEIHDEAEDIDKSLINSLNLSKISYEEISNLKVSKISLFEDENWDWRQEGSPIYKDKTFFSWDKNVAEGISLLHKENFYLRRLLKIIAFYFLPQNSCFQHISTFTTSEKQLQYLLQLGRFLFHHKIFVDTKNDGTYVGTTYLQREHFLNYMENDLKEINIKYTFSRQVKNWRMLSENKLIPAEYRLDFDPFEAEDYKKIAFEMQQNKGTYLPISIDTLSVLVPICIDFIEKYSGDIFEIYDILWPIIAGNRTPEARKFGWNNAIDKLSKLDSEVFDLSKYKCEDKDLKLNTEAESKLLNAISNHPNWVRTNPIYRKNFRTFKKNEVLEIACKLGIELNFFENSTYYNLMEIKHDVESLVSELRNACVVILFLVTGMRCSEMYLLKTKDCWNIKGSDDNFYIRIDVSKTSEASSGEPVVLPIPQIGYKAFECLKKLSEKARTYYKSDKLLLNVTTFFGKEIRESSIRQFLSRWCENIGIEHIHPHQFRKTIAMFAIFQNPNNVGIIKRLFSHKSLAMTLAYIVKLPGMNEEIKLAAIEQNKQLLGELLEAIDKDCVGGKAGNRIKKELGESKIFKSKLHDDGWESLEQYIEILLQDGLKILHRTSFGAICTNTHSGLTHLGPETCNCNVVDCDWAVFTEASIEDLKNDIKFHRKLLEKDCTEEQKRFSSTLIKNCLERLSELKGRENVSIQFPELINTGV